MPTRSPLVQVAGSALARPGRWLPAADADFARFGGTATSTVRANPEVSGKCPALTMP